MCRGVERSQERCLEGGGGGGQWVGREAKRQQSTADSVGEGSWSVSRLGKKKKREDCGRTEETGAQGCLQMQSQFSTREERFQSLGGLSLPEDRLGKGQGRCHLFSALSP